MKKLKIMTLMLAIGTIMATSVSADYDQATIKEIQQVLNDKGYECGTPDGLAGNKTYEAIKAYQEDNGLSIDGEISDELVEKLLEQSDTEVKSNETNTEEKDILYTDEYYTVYSNDTAIVHKDLDMMPPFTICRFSGYGTVYDSVSEVEFEETCQTPTSNAMVLFPNATIIKIHKENPDFPFLISCLNPEKEGFGLATSYLGEGFQAKFDEWNDTYKWKINYRISDLKDGDELIQGSITTEEKLTIYGPKSMEASATSAGFVFVTMNEEEADSLESELTTETTNDYEFPEKLEDASEMFDLELVRSLYETFKDDGHKIIEGLNTDGEYTFTFSNDIIDENELRVYAISNVSDDVIKLEFVKDENDVSLICEKGFFDDKEYCHLEVDINENVSLELDYPSYEVSSGYVIFENDGVTYISTYLEYVGDYAYIYYSKEDDSGTVAKTAEYMGGILTEVY